MSDKTELIEAWSEYINKHDPDYSPLIRTADLVADFAALHAADEVKIAVAAERQRIREGLMNVIEPNKHKGEWAQLMSGLASFITNLRGEK